MASLTGRFKELLKKYGKVAVGVHFSVSAVTVTGLYVAIKNNADVESIFAKLHLPGVTAKDQPKPTEFASVTIDGFEEGAGGGYGDRPPSAPSVAAAGEGAVRERNRTAEHAATTGGALALAVLLNKALIPVRIPITVALTPPIARFLARRRIIK